MCLAGMRCYHVWHHQSSIDHIVANQALLTVTHVAMSILKLGASMFLKEQTIIMTIPLKIAD